MSKKYYSISVFGFGLSGPTKLPKDKSSLIRGGLEH